MELLLIRKDYSSKRTIGELYLDGMWFCYTLEDPVRQGPKVPGNTAIPAGRYDVVLTMSHRFKTVLPLLEEVPDFTGIRIHAGNTESDTEGCILVGKDRTRDTILQSRFALAALLEKLREPITITIIDRNEV